jgi:hypothetical protein
MKKESILFFTKESFFGCDVFILHLWKLQRSTLLRKVVFTAVERSKLTYSVVSSQKEFDLTAAGKSRLIISSTFKKEVDFSQLLGKTSGFLALSSN